MLRGSNLTDRGRDHARTIGEAIRALAIPIGPYCSDIGSQSSRCLRVADDVRRLAANRGVTAAAVK